MQAAGRNFLPAACIEKGIGIMEQQFRERFTTGADGIEDAYAVRMEVFVDEQGFLNEKDSLDETALHLVLFDGETPVATCRAFPSEGGVYKIGRVAVRKAYRGFHLGLRLMQSMEAEIRRQGGKKVKISVQVQAVPFYEKAGYIAHGEEYLDEHCPHLDMDKVL